MKNTIICNSYSNYITDAQLSELINDINVDSSVDYNEVSVSLWHLGITKTGYGHWRISVELELNGSKLVITHTTTDSMSIDDYNSEDGDMDGDYNEELEAYEEGAEERSPRGFNSLLSECVNNNEDEIIDCVLNEQEAE